MKFIHQSELDRNRWDLLVKKHATDVFSLSWYLDSCAHDWCVLVDKNFENGIALSFTVKLGIKTISPPIFVRNLDFIGQDKDFQQKALYQIAKEFKAGHLQSSHSQESVPSLFKSGTRVFQAISGIPVLHKQAKRMLPKAVKNGIAIAETKDWKPVFQIIRSELTEKISEFTPENLGRLEKLILALEKENKLCCLGIYRNEQLEGGMIFMDSAEKRIYLKGAANRETRDAGGMYSCMHESIAQTIAENRGFDFGGSGIEGVRRFNLNLGGTDQPYYIYSWNKAPWWFNLTKWMYQKWKKK